MQDWVDEVLTGEADVSDLIPVNAAPTKANAELLANRLSFIESEFIEPEKTRSPSGLWTVTCIQPLLTRRWWAHIAHSPILEPGSSGTRCSNIGSGVTQNAVHPRKATTITSRSPHIPKHSRSPYGLLAQRSHWLWYFNGNPSTNPPR